MVLAFLLITIFAAGLSWVIIYLKGHWLAKAIFITLSIYLSLSIFLSAENFKGWATSQPLPEDFEIEWVKVQEPNDVNNGAIYIWISDVDFEPKCYPTFLCLRDTDVYGPRAYIFKYSPEDHSEAVELMDRIKGGEKIFGEIIDSETENNSEFLFDNVKIYDLPILFDDSKKSND
jgi:hypothetical protein